MVCLVLMGLAGHAAAATIYVDGCATGQGTGQDWDNAFNYLQDALAVAAPNDVIQVANGVYYPDQSANEPNGTGMREATFQLVAGVTIRGGYIGNTVDPTCCLDVDPDEWNINTMCCCECEPSGGCDNTPGFNCDCCLDRCVGKTVLCGDIGIEGDPLDNSYHVVTGSGVGPDAVLENVTVQNGYADGASYPDDCGGGMINVNGDPTVRFVCFENNFALDSGGGMYNVGSSPRVESSSFCYNSSALLGGGLSNYGYSFAEIVNCVFTQNSARATGGGIHNDIHSDSLVTNCTLFGNTAGFYGGGMYNNSSDPRIYNSIFWANSAQFGPQLAIVANNSDTYVYNCDLMGGWAAVYSETSYTQRARIMDMDPMFVNPPCDLRLTTDSPALDASDNDLVEGMVDRDGNDRFIEIPQAMPPAGFPQGTPPIADLGAYERPSVVYVDDDAAGDNDGTSWANAYTDLQDALANAMPGDQIWIAEGTYVPTDHPHHREVSFVLRNDLHLIGGFVGTETDIYFKGCADPTLTVLSGDIDNIPDTPGLANPETDYTFTGNSWHVVVAEPGINETAVLESLTIRGGYAEGTAVPGGFVTNGGGMLINDASPVLKCVNIETNYAYDSGGGIFNNGGSPKLIGCEIFNNYADIDAGGGMANVNGADTLIACSQIYDNHGVNFGGGVFNANSTITVVDSSFSGNGVEGVYGAGGGMCNVMTDVNICMTTFSGNIATVMGGGMFSDACADLNIYNSTFNEGNFADFGGGMANVDCGGTLLIAGCLFLDNEAESRGGGVYNELCPYPRIVNCTFLNNEASRQGEGGGLYNAFSYRNFIVANSIFWGNMASVGGPEMFLFDVDGEIINTTLEDFNPNNRDTHGNVDILDSGIWAFDPSLNADGSLPATSAAVNMGVNAELPDCLMVDIQGNDRITDGIADGVVELIVDLGAFETPEAGPDQGPACWNFATQCHGDVDGNGFVDTSDWPTYRDGFGKCSPDAGYQANICADFNRDGCINTNDWPMFRDNFNSNVPADCQ